jgi:hypothetical protein
VALFQVFASLHMEGWLGAAEQAPAGMDNSDALLARSIVWVPDEAVPSDICAWEVASTTLS